MFSNHTAAKVISNSMLIITICNKQERDTVMRMGLFQLKIVCDLYD